MKPLRIAHRGASGYAPENTLAAFQKALDMKSDMIELDVRKCKSGEIVVIHDNSVNRTTNGKGKVAKHTLKQLEHLDAGSSEKIPTLEEVIQLIKKQAIININVKEPKATTGTLEILKKYIQKGIIEDNSVITSAERISIVRTIHKTQLVPTIPSLYFFPRVFVWFLKRMKPDAIEVYKKVVSKKLVDIAHSLGTKVYVWTVNTPEDIHEMKGLGVDGIITDFPDRV